MAHLIKAARRYASTPLAAFAASLLLVGSPFTSFAQDQPAPVAQMPEEEEQQPARAAPVIEEIIVTARKREENLLEIPESVTSFSETSIERANISGLSDISLLVPNLYMGRRTDGFPNVSIRGLGAFGNTQGVGFYVDDVQMFGDASSRFGDLERIEVLKGPQGILYGGTNIGGAVKYILQRPDPEEFSGRIRVRAGEDDYYDTELMLNIPLAEGWAARLFYFGESDDSFLRNPNSQRLSGGVNDNDRDPGEIHRYGVRGSLAGDITERLSVYASLRYNELDGPNDVWSRELNGRLRYNDNIDTSFNPEHYRQTWGWSVELNYEFDAFTVTSITSKGGIHLTGAWVAWRGGSPSRWQALPEVCGRVPGLVPDRRGLLGLPGVAAMARWLCLPELRPRWGVAPGRWSLHVPRVRRPNVGDSGHDLRPDPHAADGMVHRLLAVRQRQGWHLGAEPEADAGDRLLSDGVGDAASAEVGAGAPGA